MLFRSLFIATREAQSKVVAVAANQFELVFTALSPLYGPIDRFFNDVMVMVEDEGVRNNRLALLHEVKTLFLTLGDLAKIVQEKK